MITKKILVIFFLMLIFSPSVFGAEVQPQPSPSQSAIDSNVLRFIQQEELKTRSEMKQFITDQQTVNQDAIQEQIEYNKQIIYKDLNSMARGYIFKAGVVIFSSIVCALVCYRLIMMQVKQKFIKKNLREELKSM